MKNSWGEGCSAESFVCVGVEVRGWGGGVAGVCRSEGGEVFIHSAT